MTAKTDRPYHHGNLKQELIETTLEMIEKEGPESITMRELAKRLGTSRTAPYRHYDSKEALLHAATSAGEEMLDDAIRLITQNNTLSAIDRLYRSGRAYLQFALEHPSLYRMIFSEEHDRSKKAHDTHFATLLLLVKDAQEEGIILKEDPSVQAAAVYSLLHGLCSLEINGHLQQEAEKIYEQSFRILLEGMAETKLKLLSSLPFAKPIF